MIEESEVAACLRRSLNRYFKDLDGEEPSNIYDMVLSAFEKPLLIYILDHADGGLMGTVMVGDGKASGHVHTKKP